MHAWVSPSPLYCAGTWGELKVRINWAFIAFNEMHPLPRSDHLWFNNVGVCLTSTNRKTTKIKTKQCFSVFLELSQDCPEVYLISKYGWQYMISEYFFMTFLACFTKTDILCFVQYPYYDVQSNKMHKSGIITSPCHEPCAYWDFLHITFFTTRVTLKLFDDVMFNNIVKWAWVHLGHTFLIIF